MDISSRSTSLSLALMQLMRQASVVPRTSSETWGAESHYLVVALERSVRFRAVGLVYQPTCGGSRTR